MNYLDYNDNELLMYIGENDDDASDIMYKKYYPLIYNFSRKLYQKAKYVGLELNDLVQEGLLGLSIAINNYRDINNTCFYTFAMTCIKRKIITLIVKSSGKKNLILNESMSLTCDDEELYKNNYYLRDDKNVPEDIVINKVFTKQIYSLLFDELSLLEKSVLELKMKGFTNKEICKKLNKNSKIVDNAIQRIKFKYKNIMDEMK